jgi:hypothetical protein
MFDRLPSIYVHQILSLAAQFHEQNSTFAFQCPSWIISHTEVPQFTSVAGWIKSRSDVWTLSMVLSWSCQLVENLKISSFNADYNEMQMRAMLNDKFYVQMPKKTSKIHDISYVSTVSHISKHCGAQQPVNVASRLNARGIELPRNCGYHRRKLGTNIGGAQTHPCPTFFPSFPSPLSFLTPSLFFPFLSIPWWSHGQSSAEKNLNC